MKTQEQEWIRTDELQFVQQEDRNNFIVLDTASIGDKLALKVRFVNFEDYNQEELEEAVSGYYESLSSVKEDYKGSWKQIVAEILAENSIVENGDEKFSSEEELVASISADYGIVVPEK